MSAPLARLLLALAVRSLGTRHAAWGAAMLAEQPAAAADGRSLRFALGCLIGAWRMLPRHGEGRRLLAGYALALGLLLPVAAMLVVATLFGFPFVTASDGLGGFLTGSGTHVSLLNAGTRSTGPVLAVLLLALAGCHLPLAWWVLDRNWARVATAMRFGAATITTLALLTACAMLDVTTLLPPVAAVVAELAAVSTFAWWHDAAQEDFGTAS
ncbi:hypothetical protein [Sphingomonas sp. Leaf25]|uniref:hypothetical protein n=1 Tax=Sphingomonas sp. Leaf25 TaxID=1735692 RepID=UPI0006F4BD0A|nr:hypothetical protein [Sphingomonas sp. Leaf25]KQM96582.1 hypothetical protein ASE78_11315 [Sphingomonas sp. Leaf25]